MRNLQSRLLPTLAIVLALLLTGTLCFADSELPPFGPDSVPAQPDYAQDASWLAKASSIQHPVDVFWVYPTVLHDSEHWLMDFTLPEMQQASHNTITKQASVFLDQANLFAPYYRQMNMAALTLPEADQDALKKYGVNDIWQAFTYYMQNLNQGRPFILAGHSQGSKVLLELMLKHWGALGYENKMIAGYFLGWSITHGDLKANPALKMCENASQINCFISYNTVAEGRQKVAPSIRQDAIVTNPLTWTTDDAFAPASLNLGAKFFNADGTTTEVAHFSSAQGKDSGLVVQPIQPEFVNSSPPPFPAGVYHVYDFSIFYENLKQNAARRIKAMGNGK
ncbi:DUF3089 domain-containing protein [Pseudodesulfovibrio sediminis]|uniref:DUF3089 domain-containing protein n=1 Tax=Pseudodesulfovibrio sediminis TaxID=2810563 RepID=A0ABM8I331_9BACT|nr:DUF3089 domain-containing protein [Pseudodesulfovibrio sediminis]BCS88781.1 hypothetical protein PSDVSF_20230 [Pseudodesulfovibrio sediminis]